MLCVFHHSRKKKASSNALKIKPKGHSKMLKKKKWLTFKYQRKPNRAMLGKSHHGN